MITIGSNNGAENEYRGVVANTNEERARAFRLRFEVYCQECGYLDPACYPDVLERDAFDDCAEHVLVYNRVGETVGCVRLVFASSLGLPTQDYFPSYAASDGAHVAEVSRLIVAPAYRGASKPILLTLAQTLYRECVQRGITGWLCTMFVPTWWFFRRLGFPFRLAGDISTWPPGSEHIVIPASFDFAEAALYLKGRYPDLYHLFVPNDSRPLTTAEHSALADLCTNLAEEERYARQSVAAQRAHSSYLGARCS